MHTSQRAWWPTLHQAGIRTSETHCVCVCGGGGGGEMTSYCSTLYTEIIETDYSRRHGKVPFRLRVTVPVFPYMYT